MAEANTKAAEAVHRGGNTPPATPKDETPSSGTQKTSRRGRKAAETLHRVEYQINCPDRLQGKVTRQMAQAALGKLLLMDGVTLINVNCEPPTFVPWKKKKR